jgi:hypothetical protein
MLDLRVYWMEFRISLSASFADKENDKRYLMQLSTGTDERVDTGDSHRYRKRQIGLSCRLHVHNSMRVTNVQLK